MFDRVIVGVDGRPGGRDAIALCRRLAGSGAEITFAHVYGLPTAAGRAGSLALPLELEAAQRLVRSEVKRSGLAAEPAAVHESSVARGLHRLAAERRADLLVVGSCHRGPLGRALLGDDTRRVLKGAPCAVAIAPRGYADPSPTSLTLARIGVGCDRSPDGGWPLEVARRLAEDRGATVAALSVVSPTDDPRQELAASSPDLDLLVVGSRGHDRVGWRVASGTSRYLARHARCPLLVLPQSADTRRRASKPQTPSTEALI